MLDDQAHGGSQQGSDIDVSGATAEAPVAARERNTRGPSDLAALLAGAKLLIVEDEYLVAQDLASGVHGEGVEIVGPFSSVDAAFGAIDGVPIGAAILDLNMGGSVAFDLAEQLSDRNVPFVFYTGYESVIVPDRFRAVPRLRKPAAWSDIVHALCNGTAHGDTSLRSRRVKSFVPDAPDLTSLIPALARRAREITSTPEMAELLVERTLERAIDEIGASKSGISMEHWLIGLLESTGLGDPKRIN